MKKLNVLSLFDGLGGGRIALEKLNIDCNYFASEIDNAAIKIHKKNFPDTVHLGDVCNIKVKDLPKIDLLIGGSPCQGFSIAGDQLAFDDPRSKLFFEFVRIKDELQKKNESLFFMLENVKMKRQFEDVISSYLGVDPILINSSLVSAQSRKRLYWTNIPNITMPKDKGIKLIDVLEDEVDDKYYHSEAAINYMNRVVSGGRNHWDFAHHSDTNKEKSACITANFIKGVPYNVLIDRRDVVNLNPFSGCSTNQPKMQHRIYNTSGVCTALTSFAGRTSIFPDKEGYIRKLTPVECERLQTIPDNYTAGVADGQRYKMIGNGWTTDVIAHIFANLQ